MIFSTKAVEMQNDCTRPMVRPRINRANGAPSTVHLQGVSNSIIERRFMATLARLTDGSIFFWMVPGFSLPARGQDPSFRVSI
jgi:hypothetical protein